MSDDYEISEHFELEELRMVLKQENIRDLLFLHLPADHIADYMVIGSCSSARHVRSTADLIYRIVSSHHLFYESLVICKLEYIEIKLRRSKTIGITKINTCISVPLWREKNKTQTI